MPPRYQWIWISRQCRDALNDSGPRSRMDIPAILTALNLGPDGVYSYAFENTAQSDEIQLRESVAANCADNYMEHISIHHSIPVMDREVTHFLRSVRRNGVILDVGGSWGWHWRSLHEARPDVGVIILDFIRNNLLQARKVLGQQVGRNVFLVHGDATCLKFADASFDSVWSVQTLQHIPAFETVVREIFRVLKPGGLFANYSLNDPLLIRFLYGLLGKKWHSKGYVPGAFYLARASRQQEALLEEVFQSPCQNRYTEVLFTPELRLRFPGRDGSLSGSLDSLLSSDSPYFSWIARQQSFHVEKPSSRTGLRCPQAE